MSFTLTLRECADADLEPLYLAQADPETKAMADHPGRDREAFFVHMRERVLPPNPDTLFRCIDVDGVLVGSVTSWVATEGSPRRLLGYVLLKQAWGKGYATEAVRRFLALMPHRPLFADVAPHNVASRRVLEKNGFRLVSEDADAVWFELKSHAQ